MKEIELTNTEVVGLINVFGGETGQKLAEKKLPVRLVLAKNRFTTALTEAYKPYIQTLEEMCKPYGVEPNNALQSDNVELKSSITELLGEKVKIQISTVIPIATLEQCETDKFDDLTSAEIDLLSLIVED